MKPRDYCCCAIPVMNAGIYAALVEQFTLGLLVGILALATPSIVGASVPGIAKIVLAIICFAAAGMQVFGFLGVFKEKAILFRRYTTIHIMLTVAAFAVAATWIIISATRHNTALRHCESDFFSNSTTAATGTDTLNESETLCNIFTWVTVGLMGGLWLLLAVMQFYLYTVISSYGTGQRRDHDEYKSIYSVTGVESGAIPLADRADPWDARASIDDDREGTVPLARDIGRGTGHARNDSAASVSTILAEKPQTEARSIYSERASATGGGAYPPQRQGTFANTRNGSVDNNPPYGGAGGFSYPSNVYTHDPQPTPQTFGSSANYFGGNSGYGYGNTNPNDLARPGNTQTHPAEGMFGRKTSRLQKVDRRDYEY
ncbi:hypothetical protein ACEPAG_235 [Sanghuangporus baumii]